MADYPTGNGPSWDARVYDWLHYQRGNDALARLLGSLVQHATTHVLTRLALSHTAAPVLFIRDESGDAGIGIYLSTMPWPAPLVVLRLRQYAPIYADATLVVSTTRVEANQSCDVSLWATAQGIVLTVLQRRLLDEMLSLYQQCLGYAGAAGIAAPLADGTA